MEVLVAGVCGSRSHFHSHSQEVERDEYPCLLSFALCVSLGLHPVSGAPSLGVTLPSSGKPLWNHSLDTSRGCFHGYSKSHQVDNVSPVDKCIFHVKSLAPWVPKQSWSMDQEYSLPRKASPLDASMILGKSRQVGQ